MNTLFSSLLSAVGQSVKRRGLQRIETLRGLAGCAIAAVVWLTGTAPVAAQTGDLHIGGVGFDALSYDSGRLYWKKNSLHVNDPRPRVQRMPSGYGSIHSYYYPPAYDQWAPRSRNMAVDANGGVFWATGTQIVTLAADALTATPTVLAAKENSAAVTQIAVSRNYVYWTETVGELSEGGKIFRVRTNGTQRGEIASMSGSEGGPVLLFAATVPASGIGLPDTEVVYFKKAGGVFVKYHLQNVLPWTYTVLSPSIDALDAANNRLYFAEKNAGGVNAIKSVAMNNTTAATTHAAVPQTTFVSVPHIAADAAAVYWQEVRDGSQGVIVRRTNAGTTNEVISAPLPIMPDESGLVSDGRYVMWGSGSSQLQTEIRRLPVNAAAVKYDLEPAGMEIVQGIQTPTNAVTLVAGKATWVRVFARIASTNSGRTSIPTVVLLRCFQNGVEMGNSPILAEAGEQLAHTRDPDRGTRHEGWSFRLPVGWTLSKGLQFTATINPFNSPAETQTNNNVISRTVDFEERNQVTAIIYPLRLNNGTIGSYRAEYQPMFDLAKTLLPTQHLNFIFSNGMVIEEWQGPFPWDFGPYELSKNDDDSFWVFLKLGLRKALYENDPFNPPSSTSIHHGALFKTFANRAFNGIAFSNMFISYVDLGGEGINRPRGGVTLAHELGHNLGRKHVNYGGPADTDDNYPYDPSQISNSSLKHMGFDPITRTVINWETTSDLMSYGHLENRPRWISAYTWKGMYDAIGRGLQSRTPRSPTGDKLLVTGVISPNGTAVLEPATRLPGTAVSGAMELVAEADDATTYRVRLLNASGATLAMAAAGAYKVEGNTSRPFFAVIDEDTDGVSLQVVRSSAVSTPIATRMGGGGAPSVSISGPVANAVAGPNIAVRWVASDPETGGEVYSTVRYSSDRGASWRVVADGLRRPNLDILSADLPGGGAAQSQFEILVSDGVRTSSARSALFTLTPHPPVPVISFENSDGQGGTPAAPVFRAGAPVMLHGSATDAEDGTLKGSGLAWTVTGPVTRTGGGLEFAPGALRPGAYNVSLLATDSHSRTATATASFSVTAKNVPAVTAAPVIDGIADEPEWLLDSQPVPVPYQTADADGIVRLMRDSTWLYVSATGLRMGSNSRQHLAVSIDADNGGSATPQTGDRRFIAYADGEVASEQGNGTTFVRDAAPLITARVSGTSAAWNVEMRIPVSVIGGANSQTIGMDVAHASMTATADHVHWFDGGDNQALPPAQWADVSLTTASNAGRDDDGDSMADAWEITNLGGSGTNGSGDRDKDGQTDLAEYHAGTDPSSATSRFAIAGVTVGPSGAAVRWPSLTGYSYEVETSANLREFSSASGVLAGTGGELTFTVPSDAIAGSDTTFIRLRSRRLPQP